QERPVQPALPLHVLVQRHATCSSPGSDCSGSGGPPAVRSANDAARATAADMASSSSQAFICSRSSVEYPRSTRARSFGMIPVPFAYSFETSSAFAANVGVDGSRQMVSRRRMSSGGSIPITRYPSRITRSHDPPNILAFLSHFLTRRDSDERMASAEAGFSEENDKYCGGRPV